MAIVTIRSLTAQQESEVSLAGWVWGIRGSGKVQFLNLRDGTGFVQVVVGAQDVPAEQFEAIRHAGQESAVRVQGRVIENLKAPGGVEVQATSVVVVQLAHNYPIGPKEHGTDFLMDHRHLWLRSPRQLAILQVRHVIIQAVRSYFDGLDFTLVDAPIFTPNACEGTTTLFPTEYFGDKAYLSQSGQLYMEAACMAVGKAYCFGPTFRAENSNTRRHLTEFWMVEPEVAWMDLEGDMVLAEGLVSTVCRAVLERCSAQLSRLERDTTALSACAEGGFPRISYDQAVEILRAAGTEFSWGDDFGGADETIISGQFGKPVFVYGYPSSIKPFYMKRDPDRPEICRNMDLLAPEGYGEIIGGGQREEDLSVLESSIHEQGLDNSVFGWYLDLRRWGSVPHAGFGLGIERTVAWICGLPHVRETIPFPRLPGRLSP